ncbi:hypothetical protein [Escherichia sp. E4385]|uniref:hypothetical protein n=1 Tax=Escherichia sp. E4385 TaxID=2040639 RepID=UPI00148515BD|nr:hypothetical protein [Escherichia sp. E4385]
MTTLDPLQLWRRTARTGNPGACKTMHLLHARLKNGVIAEKWHKKIGIHGAGLGLVLSRLLARNAPITLLRHMLATITRKIVVHGFS